MSMFLLTLPPSLLPVRAGSRAEGATAGCINLVSVVQHLFTVDLPEMLNLHGGRVEKGTEGSFMSSSLEQIILRPNFVSSSAK